MFQILICTIQQSGRFSIVKEKWSKILISFLSNGIATIIVFRNKHPLVLFGRKRWRVFQSPSKRFYRCNFFNLEPGISCDPHCGRAVGGQRIVGGALSDLFHPVCSHFSVSIPHFSGMMLIVLVHTNAVSLRMILIPMQCNGAVNDNDISDALAVCTMILVFCLFAAWCLVF